MIRTLTAIALLAAVASPAAAADIKVNIAGKDPATVEALLKDAARTVCRDEMRGSLGALFSHTACVELVFADAMEQAKPALARYASASTPTPTPLAVTRISASN